MPLRLGQLARRVDFGLPSRLFDCPARLPRLEAGRQQTALAFGESHHSPAQRGQLVQPRPAQQEALGPPGGGPLGRGLGQQPALTQRGAILVQPAAQPRPGPQQRLVGDLHRRPARGRVAVEGEEAGAAEGVERTADGRRPTAGSVFVLSFAVGGRRSAVRDRKPLHLSPQHPAPRVLDALAQRHQTGEEGAGGGLFGGVQRAVDGVGPLGQRAADAAQLPVGVERQTAVPAALEKFAEGVLQQRQRAGLLVDIGH